MSFGPFKFSNQSGFYSGKVRDVYYFNQELAMVVSDRISAFDHILPKPIPYKGQVLNSIASHFLQASKSIVPNWLDEIPHANVAIGKYCEPIKLEMVVRGYLAGHAWRTYAKGERVLCGVTMPEGMKEGDKFSKPIVTPATKAEEGHDEDISAQDILAQGIVDEALWQQLKKTSLALFAQGTEMADKQGLLLVDTKYEFGLYEGNLTLIDEIHTADSSRYYIKDGYQERQLRGERQKQLSKEFVREWLMENGFQGLEGQQMPNMPEEFVSLVTERYIDLHDRITGKSFEKKSYDNIDQQIFESIEQRFSNE